MNYDVEAVFGDGALADQIQAALNAAYDKGVRDGREFAAQIVARRGLLRKDSE